MRTKTMSISICLHTIQSDIQKIAHDVIYDFRAGSVQKGRSNQVFNLLYLTYFKIKYSASP